MKSPNLAHGTVHLFYTNPDELPEDVEARIVTNLDTDERVRHARFKADDARRQFASAHSLLRNGLASLLVQPEGGWRFQTTQLGRPYLDPSLGFQGIHFSLSHTKSQAACAIGRVERLGLDVERIDAARISDLAIQVLAPAENSALMHLCEEARGRAFFRLWTMKEALLKALGVGLTLPPTQAAFDLHAPRAMQLPACAGDLGLWRFMEPELGPLHACALAIYGPAHRLIIHSMKAESLA